jgi:hypothetical protein
MGLPAAITPDKNVIRIHNYTNPSYDTLGLLQSFNIGEVRMVFCEIEEFKPFTVTSRGTTKSINVEGYYPKDKYDLYLDGKMDIGTLYNKYRYTKLEYAKNEDIVHFEKLTVKPPAFDNFMLKAIYSWDYNENESIFTNDIFQNVLIPNRALDMVSYENYYTSAPSQSAIQFFGYNKFLIMDLTNDSDKEFAGLLLNQIALEIEWIINVAFPEYEDNYQFQGYINKQKEDWETSTGFGFLNLEGLRYYLSGIREYRKHINLYRSDIGSKGELLSITKLAFMLTSRAISIIPLEYRMDILKDLVKNELSEVFENIREEKLAIEVVQSFSYNDHNTITMFLERLAKPTFGSAKSTFYEVLYRRMSTDWNITKFTYELMNWAFNSKWKPDDTRGEFVKSIYLLWVMSDYNPYSYTNGSLKSGVIGVKTKIDGITYYETDAVDVNDDPVLTTIRPNRKFFYTKYSGYLVEYDHDLEKNVYHQMNHDASCIALNYISKKKNGIYWDNATFICREDEIIVNMQFNEKTETISTANPDDWTATDVTIETYTMYMGTYHIYQPVQITNPNQQTILPLPTINGEDIEAVKSNNGQNINSLIPMFLIRYVDEAGDSSDLQTCLGIAVDVASTFIPIGNLLKLKHIRTVTGLERFRIILGAVEFTSGALNFMLNYVDGCDQDGFCRRLKTFLFWLEMSTLSADAVSARMSRNSAKEITDNGFPSDFDNELAIMQIEDLALHADTLADIARYLDDYLNEVRRLINKRLDKDINGVFNKKFYRQEFTDSNLSDLINSCLSMQLTDKEMIADFVAMSCRAKKKSTCSELLIQITYFKKNILKKGFPTGFASIADYRLFCNQIKDYFDSFDDFPLDYQELRVQGSVLKVRHPDDPIDADSIPYLIREDEMVKPGDIDIDILMTRESAKKYADYAKKYWNNRANNARKSGNNRLADEYSKNIKEIESGLAKGLIKGKYMPPRTPSGDFLNNLRQAQKRNDGTDIFYPKNNDTPPISEINASIVIKNTDYDLKPTMRFKY